jgi:hypothetical protein
MNRRKPGEPRGAALRADAAPFSLVASAYHILGPVSLPFNTVGELQDFISAEIARNHSGHFGSTP